MRKLTGIIWLSVLLVAVTASGAQAQGARNGRRDVVCVYQNSNFQGWEECYAAGEQVANLFNRTDNISSIRIFGDAVVSIYDDRNFNGASMQITSEIRDLAQLGTGPFGTMVNWNDRISSFRVTSPNNRGQGPRADSRNDFPGRGNARGNDRWDDRDDRRYGRRDVDSICLYEDTDYRGRVECFDAGSDMRDLGRSGDWGDRVSSIRVIGNARAAAYVDIGFRGERLIIDRDIPNLKNHRLQSNRNWDNQISSLEVAAGRAGNINRRGY